MSDLNDICEELDAVTDQIMGTLGQILCSQRDLEENMRNAFLMISKARYNVGVTRISALQYNADDLDEASTKVEVSKDDSIVTFSIQEDRTKSFIPDGAESLRKRKKDKADDLADRVQDIKINRESNPENNKDRTAKKRNPLNWFGVLAPRPLKQSQQMFTRATEQCCHLATLKARLIQLRSKHKDLMVKKRQLAPSMPDDTPLTDSGSDTGSC